jgi:hypothetical protein
VLLILGILAGKSPLMMQMARGVRDGREYVTDLVRRMYRFVWNQRFTAQTLRSGLYSIGQGVVARSQAQRLVVAIDPVNFEKPYTHELEGVSTVFKSTPPPLHGRGRLRHGYPSLTAYGVNLPEPALSYAHCFPYELDFVSENVELQAAAKATRQLYPNQALCFVGDSGLDDEKYFAHRFGQPLHYSGGPRQAPGGRLQ